MVRCCKKYFLFFALVLIGCSSGKDIIRIERIPNMTELNHGRSFGFPEYSPVMTYPEVMIEQNLEGWVLLLADIDGSGSVVNVRLVKYYPLVDYVDHAVSYLYATRYSVKGNVQDGLLVKDYYFLILFLFEE